MYPVHIHRYSVVYTFLPTCWYVVVVHPRSAQANIIGEAKHKNDRDMQLDKTSFQLQVRYAPQPNTTASRNLWTKKGKKKEGKICQLPSIGLDLHGVYKYRKSHITWLPRDIKTPLLVTYFPYPCKPPHPPLTPTNATIPSTHAQFHLSVCLMGGSDFAFFSDLAAASCIAYDEHLPH